MAILLKKGSRGNEVKQLQQALNLIADGIFGVITEEAVKSYQSANGLTVDGIVGEKTWNKLFGTTNTIPKSKRRIDEIIIHCTSSWEGQHWTVDGIRQMHIKERGWSDIGYHYVVYLDGSIHPGRNIDIIGAHCTGHNSHSIGIVYVGGLRKVNGKGVGADTRTDAQKTALHNFVLDLCKTYNLDPKRHVHPHKAFANKDCPCFDVYKEFRN